VNSASGNDNIDCIRSTLSTNSLGENWIKNDQLVNSDGRSAVMVLG
jgi:hypothetical protein